VGLSSIPANEHSRGAITLRPHDTENLSQMPQVWTVRQTSSCPSPQEEAPDKWLFRGGEALPERSPGQVDKRRISGPLQSRWVLGRPVSVVVKRLSGDGWGTSLLRSELALALSRGAG